MPLERICTHAAHRPALCLNLLFSARQILSCVLNGRGLRFDLFSNAASPPPADGAAEQNNRDQTHQHNQQGAERSSISSAANWYT